MVGVLVLLTCLLSTGCGHLLYRLSSPPPDRFVPNPMPIPAVPDDFLQQQIVDSVDDYFEVHSEQLVQNRPSAILEGRVTTNYQVGSSIFEPWRKDSTEGFERLQSTLQSIRRRCVVFIRPQGRGYSVELVVQKELEDTDRSQSPGEAVGVSRHDGTLLQGEDRLDDNPVTVGWIPLGRDSGLEQRILQDILARTTANR